MLTFFRARRSLCFGGHRDLSAEGPSFPDGLGPSGLCVPLGTYEREPRLAAGASPLWLTRQ